MPRPRPPATRTAPIRRARHERHADVRSSDRPGRSGHPRRPGRGTQRSASRRNRLPRTGRCRIRAALRSPARRYSRECAGRHDEKCRAKWPGTFRIAFDQPRRPQTGQARMPCECKTFSATRICSSRLAPLGGSGATVGPPRARGELQATGVAVTGADPPVTAGLTLRDRVPVDAVRPMNRRRRRNVRVARRRSVRRRGNVRVKAGRRRRRRRSVRRRGRQVRVKARRRGSRRRDVRGRRRGLVRVKTQRSRAAARRPGGASEGHVGVDARHVRVGGRGAGHRHERAGDCGDDERLSDVLQACSFRGARAKASPRVWVGALSMRDCCFGTCHLVLARQRGSDLPGGCYRRPRRLLKR